MSHSDTDQTSDKGIGDTPTTGLSTEFLGELDDSAAGATEAGVWEGEELPVGSVRVVVTRGPNAGSQFLLDQPVTTIGRHAASDIFLDDITVSRRHAEFRRRSPEVDIVDLGSLNGTYVNGRPVESVLLANGDQIAIGKYRLVFLTRPTTG